MASEPFWRQFFEFVRTSNNGDSLLRSFFEFASREPANNVHSIQHFLEYLNSHGNGILTPSLIAWIDGQSSRGREGIRGGRRRRRGGRRGVRGGGTQNLPAEQTRISTQPWQQ
ncbi:uncharacterized protein TrAFT101_007084 [Trichoderma asperellum]|uniref:uncharacterized protein n=1 Tax=Trichoderma asperellum TaxID=101201 RepID=UPI00331F9832|nr:hypothetical protein TrAFT101_007084 [Trichoderma asperellum]